MKKILYVITKSNWGGAQRYVFDLATNLPKGDFEVAVALGGTGRKDADTGQLAVRLAQKEIRTIFVKSFTRDVSLTNDMRAGLELLEAFRKEKPDTIHLNSSKAIIAGAVAGRLAGVPNIISTVHGWAFNEERPAWQKAVITFGHWLGVVLSHHTIVVSQFDLAQVQSWPLVKDKLSCIYNGIDLQMHFGDGSIIRNAFPPNVQITGTVGELTRNKNQIALLNKARKDASMYVAIVGDGEDRSMLERKIFEYGLGNRVKLFGFVPASEVLKGFDVFALPSLKEGLPYVLLEAKAAGLLIEADRQVGGIGEILDKDIKEFSLEQMVQKTLALY